MKSDYMKAVLCCNYRFTKRHGYLATEAGKYNSDVIGVSYRNLLTEIEIKRSKADFHADFKKQKHKIYETAGSSIWIPHYFYFAIPENDEKLIKYAIEKLAGKRYGLILIKPPSRDESRTKYINPSYEGEITAMEEDLLYENRLDWIHKYMKDPRILTPKEEGPSDKKYMTLKYTTGHLSPYSERVKIIKKASKLHSRPLQSRVKEIIAKRMSSEIANLRRKECQLTEGDEYGKEESSKEKS